MRKRKYIKRRITTGLIVTEVTKIRRKNNNCWMEILAIALKTKPRKTKAIIADIVRHDSNVTRWMARL